MTRSILVEDDPSQYDDIIRRLRRLEQGIPEDVHWVGAAGEPAFQNSWVNYDAAAGPVGRAAFFYRYNGRVYLGGVIKSGANNTTAFTLPAGYLPFLQGSSAFAVTASLAAANIAVLPSGDVNPSNQPGSSVTTWCHLDGVSFRHA